MQEVDWDAIILEKQQELRDMEVNKETAKRYYDPELISILLTALGALGSVAAIVGGAIEVIEYGNSRREREAAIAKELQHRYSIREEARHALHSLSISVDHIGYELGTLEDLYRISHKANKNLTMRFGNGSMWLDRYQFEKFYRTQTQIVDEACNIYSSLRLVEELLLTGENESLVRDLGCNVKARHMLEDGTETVNRLISEFGKISIEEFISESIKICRHTRHIIRHLEDNLRRNYM